MQDKRPDGRRVRHQHRRPELLEAVTEYILENGLTDLALRPLAVEIGVTHSTLLRHFSTKDDLIFAVIEKIRTDFFAESEFSDSRVASIPTVELLRSWWKRLNETKQHRQFLLLFELVSMKERKTDKNSMIVQSIVDAWAEPLKQKLEQDGLSKKEATSLALIIIAQVRGLKLDLILMGRKQRTDQAFNTFLELIETRIN